MSGRYVPVPASAIRERLAAAGFRLLPASRGEEVYERRHDRDARYAIKVYSSIQRGCAEVRDCGADAIRVVAIHYTGDMRAAPDGSGWIWAAPDAARGIFKATRVYRTGSVEKVLDRMIERAREAYATCNAHRAGRPTR